MSGECIESGQSRVANVGECIESGQFSKMTILASTRIHQKWQIFGEYSNSTNSPASGHCLSHSQDALIVRSLSFFNFRFIETDDGTSLNLVGTSNVEVAI